MTAKTSKNARTLASERAGKGGVVPPKDRQFGQLNGNKRGKGFWKKEDTPRYKLEQMMTLTVAELQAICENNNAPAFERKLARCIANGEWKEIEGMINQVYGMPKQPVEAATEIKLKSFLPKPKKETPDAGK